MQVARLRCRQLFSIRIDAGDVRVVGFTPVVYVDRENRARPRLCTQLFQSPIPHLSLLMKKR
jgi:hypothetical protein